MICRLLNIVLIVLASTFHMAHATGEPPQNTAVKADAAPASAPEFTVVIEEDPENYWGLAIKYGLPALIGVIGTIAVGILVKNKVMKKPDSGAQPKADSDLDLLNK